MKEEIVDNNELLNSNNKLKLLVQEDKYEDVSIKGLKKDYSNKAIELEEALLNYMGENDLKFSKTGFPDKWKYLTKKLAYRYEYFDSIDDSQKPVDNLKKRYFFSKKK